MSYTQKSINYAQPWERKTINYGQFAHEDFALLTNSVWRNWEKRYD